MWGGERGGLRGKAEGGMNSSTFKCNLHCQNVMQIEFQRFCSTRMITEISLHIWRDFFGCT